MAAEAFIAAIVTAQTNLATATKRMETVTATDIPQTATSFTNMQFLVIHPPLITTPLMEMDSRNPKRKKLAIQMLTTEFTRGSSRQLKRHFHLQLRLAQPLLKLPRKVTIMHTGFQLQPDGHEGYKNKVTSNRICLISLEV
jgi:hypothetical protein